MNRLQQSYYLWHCALCSYDENEISYTILEQIRKSIELEHDEKTFNMFVRWAEKLKGE
jgi:hypothetical protein